MTRGFTDVQRKLQKAQRQVPDAVEDSVSDDLDSIIRRAKRYIIQDDAVATAELFHAFYKISYESKIEIGNDAPHAKYVEYGTGTYFGTTTWPVPSGLSKYKAADFSSELIVEIMQWARIKPSLQIHSNLRGFAVEVAKEIDEKGTEAQPFFRPAVHKGLPTLHRNARSTFSTKLNRIFT
jgi:hypothetical protein